MANQLLHTKLIGRIALSHWAETRGEHVFGGNFSRSQLFSEYVGTAEEVCLLSQDEASNVIVPAADRLLEQADRVFPDGYWFIPMIFDGKDNQSIEAYSSRLLTTLAVWEKKKRDVTFTLFISVSGD